MGLRNWLHNRSMSDPVPGTFRLTSRSASSPGAMYATCRMMGVVTGPGVGPVPVEHRCTAPTKRWPQPGDELPVTVDRADPTRLRVRWDDMPTNRQRGMRAAEQLAEEMSAGPLATEQPITGQQALARDAAAQIGGQYASAIAEALSRQFGTPVSVSVDGTSFSAPGSTNNLTAAEAQTLITTGEPATAVVTAVTPVQVPQAFLPTPEASLADLRLRVTRADGTTYDAGTRLGFRNPQRQAAIGQVGRTLPVRIDPSDPARVAIDVAAFDAADG